MGEVDGEPVCIDRARDPEELERDRNGGGGDALASSSGDVHGDEETELRKEKERDVEMEEAGEDAEVEDEEGEEAGSGSDGDSFIDDESDGEGHSDTEDKNLEAPLTDAEIEELIAEFLEVESKAAEAQESLEKESLLRVESEVRGELAESLHGDELEIAVSMEMKTFSEEWQRVLNDLETESALLLEQLDGAGVELPTLYKWIESQAPNVCCTETWKKRTQWVGSELSSEITNSIKDAESFLQSCRPVRRQHGRLLEEGASGFLGRKFSTEDDRNAGTENSEKDWRLFNELIQSEKLCENSGAFGTKQWASVYMASTPRQAAIMGLNLPGIDEVEEISEIESNPSDPFYADAIANEKDIDLSEEQRRNFRKVKEEDDVHTTQKLQLQLKRLRQRSRIRKEPIESDSAAVLTENISRNFSFDEHSKPFSGGVESLKHGEGLKGNNDHNDVSINESDDKKPMANDTNVMLPTSNFDLSELKRPKRPHDDEDLENDAKRNHTVIIDSDDEVQVVEDKSVFGTCSDAKPMLQAMEVVDVDAFPSPSPKGLHNHPKANLQVFQCTSCSVDLKVHEVHRHPLLQVIVCESCNNVVKEQMNQKDRDCSECYCGWCGKSEDLISCSTCTTLFCTKCIKRNLGEEHLAEVLASSSQCCCCSPSLLHEFTLECDKALGSLDVTSSDSDSELSDVIADAPNRYKKMKKRRIRRILDDAELMEDTKRKIAIEKARQEHLKSLQEQSAIKSWTKNVSINGITTEGANVEMLGDANDGYIVNVVREKDEEPVRIPPSISAKLKPHQVSGIRFMWENIIQSIRKVKSGDKGLGCILAHTMGLGKTFQVKSGDKGPGCILAHTMGLGKTFQVIAFLYTAMRVVDLGLKTALIVTPVNVLHNWRHEFEKWKPLELKPLRVFMLEDVARERRAHLLAKWKAKGGVFLIGYASFRNLSLGKHVKDRSIATDISHALQNGPDVLICDEAHMIKNTRAGTTHALKQVKSQRRIALTGSPLQNNLMEYYCMVDFVREGFLGSSHEFRNRFQNPIENGQHTNSTSDDVKIMNQRSHILHEQLKGFVQRMDMNVVKKDLPPKTEFVIIVKLSPLQRKLYKRFLDVHGFTNGKISSEKVRRSCFFAAYQALAQIWNHPGLLQMAKEYKDKLRRQEAIENSLIDGSSSDDNVERDVLNGVTQKVKDSKKSDGIFFHEEVDWWEELLHEKIYKEVDYSGKMVLLLDILSMSSEMGDKALVFSQSLMTLDLIELFLSRLPQKGREGKCWKQGKDWYRLDGSTEGSERQKIVERFNDPTNKRVKCTLISTRAGSLGINLHAANRVIIIDGSWNPTNDLQAIYRVWRYGQIKPVYAYRLMAHKTMEEKIYKRQVTKEGLAARVVDRQQIHRTMSKEEVLHLFDFGDDENPDVPLLQCQEGTEPSAQNLVVKVVDSLVQKSLPSSSGGSSSDKVMDGLLNRHYSRWIAHYHEHETLLQENEEERLTKEEQDMAWVVFQRSLEWEEVHRVSLDEPDQTSAINHTSRVVTSQTQTKGSSKNRSVYQRKCNNLKHMLTLRSQGIKSGSSTVCGDCGMQISWDNLKDGKSR